MLSAPRQSTSTPPLQGEPPGVVPPPRGLLLGLQDPRCWAQTEDPGSGKGSSLSPADAEAVPQQSRAPSLPRGQQPAQLSTHGLGAATGTWQGGGGAPAKGNELEIRPPTSCGPQTAEPAPLGSDPYQPGRRRGSGQHRRPLRPPGAGVGEAAEVGPWVRGRPLGRPSPAPRALRRGPGGPGSGSSPSPPTPAGFSAEESWPCLPRPWSCLAWACRGSGEARQGGSASGGHLTAS